MTIYATQRFSLVASEVRNFAIGYIDALDSGELLTGTPTITEVTTTDFTLANKAVSTGSLTINGVSHAAGQAVQFKATVGADPTLGAHEITISASTDATPAQTIIRSIWIDVI